MRSFDYTWLESKTWNTNILNLVAKIHEFKGRQEVYLKQKTVELNRLIDIAKIQSTEASNKIEGIVTTNTRLKQLLEEKTSPRNRDENEILGYRDVLNTIHENYKYIPIRSSFILQLHRDLFYRTGLSYGGKFKNTQNYINETRANGTSITRFVPVPPYETPEAVKNLCFAFEQAISQEKVDPLILIPVFVSDFLCIHPFNDGNGRMSRLLTLLLLYQSGYNIGKYISIEKEIEKTKDLYYEALNEVDSGWFEEKNDPTAFIEYFLTIILSCYTQLEDRIRLIDLNNENSSAYDIVKTYVKGKVGKFTSADVLNACPSIGRSSVLASLKKLTEEGVIKREGSGKGTFYYRIDSN